MTQNLPFTLSIFTPSAECEFLAFAIEALRIQGHHGSLLALAQIETDPLYRTVAQQNWIQALDGSEGTHISRITGLSWLPVRVLCAQFRDLMTHPSIQTVVTHPWFAGPELDKLLRYFPTPSTDTAEVIRTIVGWTDKRQLFGRYLRTNHILLELQRTLISEVR